MRGAMVDVASERVLSPARREMRTWAVSAVRVLCPGTAIRAGESAKSKAKGESVRNMVSSRCWEGSGVILRHRTKRK